ncbi:hypothetical protein T492DRAFT_1058874 [Pavlovales sp. CCMP2436]|nr:hypothetical protein T492DRAFT_1058874 [Pavlovales sp. CCMP2436]
MGRTPAMVTRPIHVVRRRLLVEVGPLRLTEICSQLPAPAPDDANPDNLYLVLVAILLPPLTHLVLVHLELALLLGRRELHPHRHCGFGGHPEPDRGGCARCTERAAVCEQQRCTQRVSDQSVWLHLMRLLHENEPWLLRERLPRDARRVRPGHGLAQSMTQQQRGVAGGGRGRQPCEPLLAGRSEAAR